MASNDTGILTSFNVDLTALSWCKSDGQMSTLEGHATTIAVYDYAVNATVLTSCNIESGQRYMWRAGGFICEKTLPRQALFQKILSIQQNLRPTMLNGTCGRKLSTWEAHTTAFAISNYPVCASLLTAFDIQRRNRRVWWVVVCQDDICCLKLPCQSKVLTSFDVKRVDITYCGGLMNVRGQWHERHWLKAFRQCNNTYVLWSSEEWSAYENV
jgi:hypothetical protein